MGFFLCLGFSAPLAQIYSTILVCCKTLYIIIMGQGTKRLKCYS